jgi:exonuclease III
MVAQEDRVMANEPNGKSAFIVGSYNCEGHGDVKIDYIRTLMLTCHVLFIQEHWLFSDNIVNFAQSIGDVNIHGKSGMDGEQLQCGRPYGGCAIVWRRSCNVKFVPIECENKRIVAGYMILAGVKLLLCNAYMPCDGSYRDPMGQSYEDVLMDIGALVEGATYDHVIVGGDLNTDFNRLRSQHVSLFTEFCRVQNLYLCREHPNSNVDFTFVSASANSRSEIDHIAVSQGLRDRVIEYGSVHDGGNVSWHSPVILKMSIPVSTAPLSGSSGREISQHEAKRNWKLATPDEIEAYGELLGEALEAIELPIDALRCNGEGCQIHRADIKRYLDRIIECCDLAARATIGSSMASRASPRSSP